MQISASEKRKRCRLTNMTPSVESAHFHLHGNGKFQIMKESAFSS